MMLGIMPLDISIEYTAVNTYHNIKGTYEIYWNSTTHLNTQAGFRHAMELLTNYYYPERRETDRIRELDIHQQVIFTEPEEPDIQICTDGSGYKNTFGYGYTISGHVEHEDSETKHRYFKQK